jgi:hypothetical protein
MQVLIEARRTLRDLEDERLVLEMAVVELLRIRELQTLRDAMNGVAGRPAAPLPRARAAVAAVAAAPPAPPPAPPRAPIAPPADVAPASNAAIVSLDPAGRLTQLRAALLRESHASLAVLLQGVVAVREENGVLLVAPAGAEPLPAFPNVRLDEATRRLGKKLFAAPLVVRSERATTTTDEAAPPSRRRDALEQIQELFGGETVAGSEPT